MKTIIIILSVFLTISSFSQDNDLLKHVDTFFEKCNSVEPDYIYCKITNEKNAKTEVITRNRDIEIVLSLSDLSDPIELIDYIENEYLIVQNPWIRKGILTIFEKLLMSKELYGYESYKQNLTLIALNNSLIDNVDYLKRYDSSYFNDNAKNKLIKILENKYNKEDLVLKRLFNCRKTLYDTTKNSTYKKYIINKAKKANMTVPEWSDSLYKECIKKSSNIELSQKSIKVPRNVLFIIGNANLTDLAPSLEILLNNELYNRLHDDILLVLAKFQYKDYEKIYINKLTNLIYKNTRQIDLSIDKLRYIGSQNSVFVISQFLSYTHNMKCSCKRSKMENKMYGYFLLFKLCQYIDNFPFNACDKEIKYSDDGRIIINLDANCFCLLTDKLPVNVLELTLKWMKKNKGSYKINESFYLKF